MQEQQKMDAHLRAAYKQSTAGEYGPTEVRIIPVVFHVMYNGNAENITKATILAQLKTLNEDFRARNKDTQNIHPEFKHLVADAYYEFRLASYDENGQPTDGIERIKTTRTTNADDSIKLGHQWNPKHYLNIWVVKSINSDALPPGSIIAGYAHFPFDLPYSPQNDGVVVDYRYVGLGQRTLTHEIGHFLGLYHTFQGACWGGDEVYDTPPALKANFGCRDTNSCHNDEPDLQDMIENYMDYADCKYLFTPQQVERMHGASDLYRYSLSSQNNLLATLGTTVGIRTPVETTTTPEIALASNPVEGMIRLSSESDRSFAALLEIHDLNGRLLYRQRINIPDGKAELSIDPQAGSRLTSGLYFLKINAEYWQATLKMVIR